VIERSPTTSYDVDRYEPKQGDTWESISREFYNDTRYANALKAVNLNKPLTTGGTVDIPPLYILKQKFQTLLRSGTTVSQTSPVPTPTAPTWGPPVNATTPAAQSGGSKIYRVPTGGTTERDLAKNFLGNDQRWMEIFNLNPHITDPNSIPAGTEVKLPMDARLP
jgi:nucleoid-associated protein YgaU